MIQTCLVRAVLVLAATFCQTKETIYVLYTLIFLRFSVNSIYMPARTSIVPSVVEKRELVVANGLDGIVWSGMIFIGGALGGVGTALLGITGSFLLDSALFVVAGYVLALMPPDHLSETAKNPTLLDPFRDSVRYLLTLVVNAYFYLLCCFPLRNPGAKHGLETRRNAALQRCGVRIPKGLNKGESTKILVMEEHLDDLEVPVMESDSEDYPVHDTTITVTAAPVARSTAGEDDDDVVGKDTDKSSIAMIDVEALDDDAEPENQRYLEVEVAEKKKDKQKEPLTFKIFLKMYADGFRFLWNNPYIFVCCFIRFTLWIVSHSYFDTVVDVALFDLHPHSLLV